MILQKIYHRSLLLSGCVHVPEDHHLVSGSVEFPTSENEDVGANRCGSVAVSAQGRLALELSLLPNQLVVGVQHDKVIDVRRRDEVLLTSRPRVDAPTPEKDYVGTTDVRSMAVPWQRRSSGHSDPCPLVLLGIKYSDVVEVAGLKLCALSEICSLLEIFVEGKTSLHDHICAHLKSCVALTFGRNGTLAFRLSPGHDFEI